MLSSQCHQTPDHHVDARRKIDEQITQLEAQLVSLRLSRNALAPIACLHTEILQEIFLFVHVSSDHEHKGKSSLLMTWVSHNWRELAHNTAALWSFIDFAHAEWITAAIGHTKNRGLEIDLDCSWLPRRKLVPFARVCLDNLPRTKNLTIVSTTYNEMTGLPHSEPNPAWVTPAPLLVKLHLQRTFLPSNVFSGTFQSLQFLHLSKCSFDWDTLPVSSSLKELAITDSRSRTAIDTVMKVLHLAGDNLEQLQLEDVFDHQPVPLPDLDRHRLQRLKSLKLSESHPGIISSFLARISVPRCVDISIVSPANGTESDIIHALVSLRNIGNWPVQELKIHYDETVTISIMEEWEDAGDDENFAREANDKWEGCIELKLSDVGHHDLLLPLFSLFPIDPIKRVLFTGGGKNGWDQTILDYMSRLGTVREVQVDSKFLSTFTDYLHRQLNGIFAAGPWGQSDAAIKSLVEQTITFHNLETIEFDGDPQEEAVLSGWSFEVLRKWSHWRKQGDLTSAKLVISDMTIPPISWLHELFEGVMEFEVIDVTEREGSEEDWL
ncbi:hypothetical protein BDN72DRAFT_878254 [Pluteus cervinus]|uniref:Uncharacterized protein n=1 Tax=Pluteus cervinus TaxID=181527 RepID=A0ACD3AV68_9AGAR|nr:hypothetical protein BDN72DRAFT_878254 [Pluteus cervinus]